VLEEPWIAAQQMGFASALVKWQRAHGRHDLPWQEKLDPYPVWLSEVMLQQTQVSTVKAYFAKFMDRFPRVEDLAQAQEEEVMSLWSGLGYYSRGRNLHACAQRVVQDYGGQFPSEVKDLVNLPGIGPSTAAAIASICFAKKEAIMDGNVARVLTRYLGYAGDLSLSVHQRALKAMAQKLLPKQAKHMPTYTQGIMDLGATVCMPKKALCVECPVRSDCVAHAQNRVLELPNKTKKIKRKNKSIYWLVAVNEEMKVLGGRRSLEGIWAGMHAFPEFASEGALLSFLPKGAEVQALAVVRHELTHLSLSIHPFVLRWNKKGKLALSDLQSLDWMSLGQWMDVGRPKPVTDLLAQIKPLDGEASEESPSPN
jgi:A/G-specific adenine glycosylase